MLKQRNVASILCMAMIGMLVSAVNIQAGTSSPDDDLVFLHHSCGYNWLASGLDTALTNKSYIDERNDIYYGTTLAPDSGRPTSLGSVPGDNTNMNHWILWFNDYFNGIKAHGCADGENRIIMFKSCYPISNVTADGTEPGDPFSATQTLANYYAVYRHPDGAGNTYTSSGYVYHPLEEVFAANPDTLFIAVTAPPRNYAPSDATNDAEAHRARVFNNWLKNTWLPAYNTAHPGLNNVAVFDWFDVLAYADDHATHPNRLRQEYGGEAGDSHPNSTANAASTVLFATDTVNFIDTAWAAFLGGTATPTPVVTLTRTPTISPTSTPTRTRTATPSMTLTLTRTMTATATPSRTQTVVASHTRTVTHTPAITVTRTGTATAIATHTPEISASLTITATQVLQTSQTATPMTTSTMTASATATGNRKHRFYAFPNPGSDQIRFAVEQDQSGEVVITLFNAGGEKVALLKETLPAGSSHMTWDCRSVATGIYLAEIQVKGQDRRVLKIAVTR